MNASLNGIGVEATNTAGVVGLSGGVLNGATLAATATEGDGSTGITLATTVEASGTADDGGVELVSNIDISARGWLW